MVSAKKCDVCGKFYLPDVTCSVLEDNGFFISKYHNPLDFCGECSKIILSALIEPTKLIFRGDRLDYYKGRYLAKKELKNSTKKISTNIKKDEDVSTNFIFEDVKDVSKEKGLSDKQKKQHFNQKRLLNEVTFLAQRIRDKTRDKNGVSIISYYVCKQMAFAVKRQERGAIAYKGDIDLIRRYDKIMFGDYKKDKIDASISSDGVLCWCGRKNKHHGRHKKVKGRHKLGVAKPWQLVKENEDIKTSDFVEEQLILLKQNDDVSSGSVNNFSDKKLKIDKNWKYNKGKEPRGWIDDEADRELEIMHSDLED